MDPRLRRASTSSFRERKFSNPVDRLHRQARQSILFEERKSPIFRDDLFSSLPLFRTQGLALTKTSDGEVSPTQAHPGHRLPEPRGGWGSISSKSGAEISDFFPIPRPEAARRRSVPFKTKTVLDEFALDGDAIEAQSARLSYTNARFSLWDRFLNLFPRSQIVKPGAISGLQVASAAATAHAKAILHHQSYLHNQRQHIYITEYEVGDSIKPKQIPMTLNHISGIQRYLMEASTPRFTAPLLRVIYIQNNAEAMDFLTNVFRLDHASFEKFEGSFKDWIHEQKTSVTRPIKPSRGNQVTMLPGI
jgi:hypothetical protein